MRIEFGKQAGQFRPYYLEIDPELEVADYLFQYSFSEYDMYENLDRYYISLDDEFRIIIDTDMNTIEVLASYDEFLFEAWTPSNALIENILQEFENGFSEHAVYTDHDAYYEHEGENENSNFGASLQGLYMNELPKNAENAITGNMIDEGNRMVNFHNERNFGRFYKENTLAAFQQKKNPYTKRNIQNSNIVHYMAHVKKRKTRKSNVRK